MNILFISVTLGDLSGNTGLYANLVNEFKNQGHTVYAIAPANTTDTDATKLSVENDIKVIRVKTGKFSGVSNIKKGFAYQKLVFQYIKAVRKFYRDIKIDFILSHSLPPELGIIIKFIKRYYSCPFYLMQTDYTWQDAVGFGIFKKSGMICAYYRMLEKLLFGQSDYIGVPSEGNKQFILKYYPYFNLKKFQLLYFFQKPINIPYPDSGIKAKYGLENKFVVVYGGSIGIAQKIENVIDLAEEVQSYGDIVFLMLGKGAYWEKIKEDADNRGLPNIKFLDFLPQADYLQLLSVCDAGLIVLNEKLGTPNFPSKTMSYFNLKIPVLASIDYVTDYGLFLDKYRAGLWSYSGDLEKFKENLLKLYGSGDLRKEFGLNGYNFYYDNMLPEHACKTILSCFTHINLSDDIENV